MFNGLLALCTTDAMPALPQDWWTAWSLAPATLLPLLGLLVYASAPARITRLEGGRAWGWRIAGASLLAIALTSPLCRLAATLAMAHMAQLMVIVFGAAALAMGWQRGYRRPPQQSSLNAATFCHGAVIWLWHVPMVYEAALGSPVVHVMAMAALTCTAFWFWRSVLGERDTAFKPLLALLVTMAHTGLLGALLTFAGVLLYPLHSAGARAWGLDPLEDQQLAGLLMWVPGGLGYLAAALALLAASPILRAKPVPGSGSF